jgi:hypothetical protein
MYIHIAAAADHFRGLGYRAVTDYHATASEIRAYFKADNVLGFTYFGHSDGGRMQGYDMPGEGKYKQPGFDWDAYQVEPENVQVNYRLGALYLLMCNAGWLDWEQFVSENGASFIPSGPVNSYTPWKQK